MGIFDVFAEKMSEMAAGYWPRLLAGIAVLVFGWLIALAASALVRNGLHRLKLDERLSRWIGSGGESHSVKAERMISRIVYYLLLLIVLVAFFQTLSLTMAIVPINVMLSEFTAYLPNLVGAALLLLLAWVVATLLRTLVYKGLAAMKLDERVGGRLDRDAGQPLTLAQPLSSAVYWIVFVMFLPAILDALNLNGLLGPVQGMLTPLLAYLPNLLSATLILLIGLFLAHLLRRIVSNLLAVVGVDKLGERIGLSPAAGKQSVSGLLGLIVFILVLIPVLIGTFEALRLEAITRPASNMLNAILLAVPNIFAAALILALAYVVGRVVARLIADVLARVGFNSLLPKLGIGSEAVPGQRTLADIAGTLVLVGIMLLASLEAMNILYFDLAAELLSQFLVFLGHVALGLFIFAVGLYVANLAANVLRSNQGKYGAMLPVAARVSILVMAGAMALRQMGLANDIVVLAFGLLFGSLAVTFAIAFGVGGIKIASRKIEDWLAAQERGSRP